MEQQGLFQTKKVYSERRDFSFSEIKNRVDRWNIELQPDYQRNYVMKEFQASRLIESVLMWIPLPVVYFSEESNNKYSIIDGQQRITSIVNYMKNDFSLRWLEELLELNWKKFKDLSEECQNALENASLNAIILSKESNELKYEIFARLNQWSIKLKPQELRNCIYRWSFNSFINDLAENNKHLKDLFWGDNKRKDYQENILRFFALRDIFSYSSSMDKTMNLFMSKHQNDSDNEIEKSRKLFNGTIDIVKQVLWNSAFSAYDRKKWMITKKFSWSVYDSIIIAFSNFNAHDLIIHADEIKKKIDQMKKHDLQYQDYTYAATWSKDRVLWRVMMVYNAIKEIVWKNADCGNIRNYSQDVKEQLRHDWYICSYCNQTIQNIDDAEVDHIKPYSLWWTTTIDNAQLLHRRCNREKSNTFIQNNQSEAVFHFRRVERVPKSQLIVQEWKYILLKWSFIYPEITSNIENIKKLRQTHANEINNNETIQDIVFNNPSAAGQFVYWAASNWWDDRVDINWNSLNKIFRK